MAFVCRIGLQNTDNPPLPIVDYSTDIQPMKCSMYATKEKKKNTRDKAKRAVTSLV